MRYMALACDYDGTLAQSGRVSEPAVEALRKLRRSGRRAILVTGRVFDDLARVCPDLALFDAVVLENGAVVYWPATRETTQLAEAPPSALADTLARLGVDPLVRGRVVVATTRPHEVAALEAIRDLGLELHIVFNEDAVMVLPAGVNKGTGLQNALRRLGLSQHEVVGAGNAENDHSFLDLCECSVAVANAVPSVRTKVDFTTAMPCGDGVIELIEELIATDLAERATRGPGESIELAARDDGTSLMFPPYGQNILVSGPSGAGKSTFATALIERLIARSYQLCIIDPEGDYGTLDDIVTLGTRLRAPSTDEVTDVLADPRTNLVVNLLGIALPERPDFFAQLLPRLQALRARTGRPHWLVIDEVHHLFPQPWSLVPATLPRRLGESILITHRPREVAPDVLALTDTLVAVGPIPEATIAEYATVLGVAPPRVPALRMERDEVMIWQRSAGVEPERARTIRARSERLRHLRKYAEGNLGPHSFVFRGPHGRLRLRAVNLVSFCELAEGVDEETWSFHLRAGDYSRWVRERIKDDDLAGEVTAIESDAELSARESVKLVRDAIDRRYMLPS